MPLIFYDAYVLVKVSPQGVIHFALMFWQTEERACWVVLGWESVRRTSLMLGVRTIDKFQVRFCFQLVFGR